MLVGKVVMVFPILVMIVNVVSGSTLIGAGVGFGVSACWCWVAVFGTIAAIRSRFDVEVSCQSPLVRSRRTPLTAVYLLWTHPTA